MLSTPRLQSGPAIAKASALGNDERLSQRQKFCFRHDDDQSNRIIQSA
jgi:hypothetical protein